MAYNPLNPNGQAAMANSQPVVIASNQTPISIAGTVLQQAGSIMAVSATLTPPANQSVSGAVTAPPGSVMMTAQLAGSIMAVSGSFAPAANQSVSGAVTAQAGSIMSVTFPAGSTVAVLATQVTSPWIVAPNNSSLFSLQPAGSVLNVNISGSVATVGTAAANQSVSGAVTAPAGSVMNTVSPAGSITAVSATIVAGSITSVTNPAGSITAVSATQPAGSLLTIIQLAGSILATSATLTPGSVSGAVTAPPGSVMTVATLAGSIIAVSGTTTTTAGSVITAAALAGSVMGVRTDLASVISVAKGGSIMSVTFPAGSIGAVISTAPAGSVMTVATLAGSIMAVSATAPAGSIATVVNPAGSVTTILGTYSEDAAHATADKGIFTLGVRNDTVASFASADSDYTPIGVDSAGRTINKPFASEDATIISYVGSIVSGSVQLIQASAIGKKNYITDFWLSNTGAATTLVTFQDGTTSIMGQFIAPAGGGMASPGLAIPLKPVVVAGSDLAFKVSPSTSVLYVVVKGFQAP